MKKRLGYTFVEVLILIAIIGIFSAGLLAFFMGMLKTERQARFSLKSEGDVSALRTFLKKELQSIGFGVSADYLRISPGSCGSGAVISGSISELCYLSLASRQTRWSGCWWTIDNSMNVFGNATNRFGGACPINPSNAGGYCLFLNYNRQKKGNGVSPCNDISQWPSSVVFYLDKTPREYPYYFLAKLYLSNTSTDDKSCHPNLQKRTLSLALGNDTPQPIISCVYDFHVCYIDKTGSPSSMPPSIQNLSGVRVCMIVQAGGRGSIRYQQSLTYSERCRCGDYKRAVVLPDDYQFYPFKVIEEEVSLPNLRGWGL